jgi:hypothetical protein
MSANLLVDIGGTANFAPSIIGPSVLAASGGTLVGLPVDLLQCSTYCNVFVISPPCSGVIQVQVQVCDTTSGVFWSGGGFPVSGNFVDPTAGLAQLPTWFQSGTILYVNSGLYTVPGAGWIGSGQPASVGGYPTGTFPFGNAPVLNGQAGITTALYTSGGLSGSFPIFGSGGIAFAAFQRTARWARAIVTLASGVGGTGAASSGVLITPIVGFVSQLDTTGSGGGFSWLPGSGGGNVALV